MRTQNNDPEEEKKKKEADRKSALESALANKKKLAEEAREAQHLVNAFSELLKLYIHDKENHLRKELRDGGRHLTWRKLVNPSALTRYLGGLSKNPDHAEAYDQRLTLLVYANYLSSRLANLKSEHPNAGEINLKNQAYLTDMYALLDEIKEIQNYLTEKEYKGPFVGLLKDIHDEAQKSLIPNIQKLSHAPQTLSDEEQKLKKQFRLLWPFYLITKDPGELYNNANFSAERAYAIAKSKNLNLSEMSERVFSDIFIELKNDFQKKMGIKFNAFENNWNNYIKDHVKDKEVLEEYYSAETAYQFHLKGKSNDEIYRELKQRHELVVLNKTLVESSIDKTQHSDTEIFKEGLNKLNPDDAKSKSLLLGFAAKDLGKGIHLSGFVRGSDKVMGMSLDPERFATGHTIKKIDPDKITNDKGETLEDGWYQYVIMAEGKYEHDFRYLKCSNKKGSFLQYGKYAAHSEIAGGQAVYSAGAFKVFHGKIVEMDNSSGHYEKPESAKACNRYALRNLEVLGETKTERIVQIEFPKLTGKPFREKTKRKLQALFHGLYSANHPDLARVTEVRPIPSMDIQGDHLRSFRSSQYSRLMSNMRESIQRSGPDRFSSKDLEAMPIEDIAALIKGNMELIKNFPKAGKEYEKNNDQFINAIIRKLDANPEAEKNLFKKVDDDQTVKDYINNLIKDKKLKKTHKTSTSSATNIFKTLLHGNVPLTKSIIKVDRTPQNDEYYPLFEARTGNTVKFYSDAYDDKDKTRGAFHDILNAIDQSKHSVLITGWTLSPNEKFKYNGEDITLPELFAKKALQGVNISALIWKNIAPDFFSDTLEFNNRVKEAVRKLAKSEYRKNPNGPSVKEMKEKMLANINIKFSETHLGYSDHAKMVIVDSKTLYMGGLDLTVNRSNTQTWHDCHCRVEGPSVADAIKLFSNRFHAQSTHHGADKRTENLLLDVAIKARENFNQHSSAANEGLPTMQLLTSIRKEFYDPEGEEDRNWVKGTHTNEILKSQVHAINNAKNFIYMENQFFSGPRFDIKNKETIEGPNEVIIALLKKIIDKIKAGEEFHFYCQLPFRPEGDHKDMMVNTILRKQWKTMQWFIQSVQAEINAYNANASQQGKETKSLSEYLTFTNLGFHDPNKPKENGYEMKYTHSKLMIIDDNVAFIGSNNCNERSNKGNRDHEVCMRMENYPEIKAYRQELMEQHFGKECINRIPPTTTNPGSKEFSSVIQAQLKSNLTALTNAREAAKVTNVMSTPWGNVDPRYIELGQTPPHVPQRTARPVVAVQAVSPWAKKFPV